MTPGARGVGERGFSLIELMVGATVFVVGVLGLVGLSFVTMRQANRARDDLQYSADIQQVLDSLLAKGWGNVTSGSATIRGRALTWTLTNASASNLQTITMFVPRSKYQGVLNAAMVTDTLVAYLYFRAGWPY
jgi:prepilin-type N-terminal cleavage/methylation domain-containing protein